MSEESEILFRIRADTSEADKKLETSHIKTTDLRRNMALLRRDAGLLMNFLESEGVKIDDNMKKAVKLFDQGTMIISDGARVIAMLDAIGFSANSALGVIGLLIEAITFVNQLYQGLPWAQKVSAQIYQATGIPGIRPGLLASWLGGRPGGGTTGGAAASAGGGGTTQRERPGKETA